MKFKYIMWFFAVSLCACTLIRTLQLFFTLDTATGFIKTEYKSVGVIMTAIVCVAALVGALIGVSVRRCPIKMPKINPFLGISSLLLSFAVFGEVFTAGAASLSNIYVDIALKAFGCFTGLFFAAYGLKAFAQFKLPAPLFILPVVYWAIKLIYVFMSVSTLALITDNIYVCAAYASTLVFMLAYARLANGISLESTSRMLMASGICATIFSVTASLPRFLVVLSGNSALLHESVFSTLTMLATGIFMILFIAFYFRNKNLSRHHKHSKKSNRFLPDDVANQYPFYLGRTKRTKGK